MPTETPLIEARYLSCTFGRGRTAVTAVDAVSFDMAADEIVSIVGESGSGKTTLARMLLLLQKPSSGTLLFEGRTVHDRRAHWRTVQAVFQDPFASFNQFFTVRSQLRACFRLFETPVPKAEKDTRIEQALLSVNLDPTRLLDKYPFELSGGQMQRLLLARVFLVRPKVLLADEPTSMVDACSRATILEELMELKRRLGMTIVFVTHDLGLAYHVSDRIFVMSRGSIVEQGPADQVVDDPRDDYTRKLLGDIPVLHRDWLGTAHG
ncbi:MAG: ATP-binding cassette domain-containing protein [Chitinivibrionales bacterium]|nr:ATP-binding cassette domain-containing protein [Chitinivibrionales bacterium]